jgi:hypothetical protein
MSEMSAQTYVLSLYQTVRPVRQMLPVQLYSQVSQFEKSAARLAVMILGPSNEVSGKYLK